MEFYLKTLGNVTGSVSIDGCSYALRTADAPVPIGDITKAEKIQIDPINGKFGDSEDSFIFIYTPIDPHTQNIEISAAFYACSPDGCNAGRLSGYGILSTDTAVSEISSSRHRNQLAIGRFRMNSAAETGCGLRVISGYQNPEGIEFGSVRKIDTTRSVSLVPYAKHIAGGESFSFTFCKNDEGFAAEVKNAEEFEQFRFPGSDLLTVQDPNMMYFGFAAAGRISVQITGINITQSPGKLSHTPEEAIHSAIPDYPFPRQDFRMKGDEVHKRKAKRLIVSPEGKAENEGTEQSPLDLQTALNAAEPGCHLMLLDGTYYPQTSYLLTPDQTAAITIGPQHAGEVILDGSRMEKKTPVMILGSSSCHLSGMIFQNSPSCGLFICGSHNLVEHCSARENRDTGFLMCAYPGSSRENWPAWNEIRYCTSHDNCDTERSNADGFGAKLAVGEGNRFLGCSAHHNIDDGFDLYTKSIIGPISPLTIENCSAWENGHLSNERGKKNSEKGFGYKFGGENQPVQHNIRNCTAISNDCAGFSSNSNPYSHLSGIISRKNGIDPHEYDIRLTTARGDITPQWTLSDIITSQTIYVKVGEMKQNACDYMNKTTPSHAAADDPCVRTNEFQESESRRIMFLVPRLSGGGAEKVIASLASAVTDKNKVYLVTTIRENQQETYPISDKVTHINLYKYAEEKKAKEQEADQSGLSNTVQNKGLNPTNSKKFAELQQWINSKGSILLDQITSVFKKWFILYQDNQTTLFQIETLKELKKKYNINYAVSFLNSANYLNVKSAVGEQTIISIRSCLEGPFAPPDSKTPEGTHRIKTACERADRIISVSKETAWGLTQYWKARQKKTEVIYNFADIEKIRQLSCETITDPGICEIINNAEFVYFSSGRLTAKKGQWHLIRAFREVIKAYPKAVLMILGHEGKGKENTSEFLQQIISEYGLENNVFLIGFHMNPFKYLSRGDAFVLSSFNEGFPNAMIEAMTLGLPVISTDCRSGPREILSPDSDFLIKTDSIDHAQYGILVPECSGNKLISEPLEQEEKLLSEAMLELIEDTGLRSDYMLKSVARAKDFSKEKIIGQWEAVFRSKK